MDTIFSHNVFSFFSSSNSFGDVNISAILNSFQMGYDKRVRPNYGGKAAHINTINLLYRLTFPNSPILEKMSD